MRRIMMVLVLFSLCMVLTVGVGAEVYKYSVCTDYGWLDYWLEVNRGDDKVYTSDYSLAGMHTKAYMYEHDGCIYKCDIRDDTFVRTITVCDVPGDLIMYVRTDNTLMVSGDTPDMRAYVRRSFFSDEHKLYIGDDLCTAIPHDVLFSDGLILCYYIIHAPGIDVGDTVDITNMFGATMYNGPVNNIYTVKE